MQSQGVVAQRKADEMYTSTKPAYIQPNEWKRGAPPEEWLRDRTYRDKKPLPALASKEWELPQQRQDVLLSLYSEVCNGWRTLTDVRFKLLGLVPIVSVTVAITLLSRGEVGKGMRPIEKIGVAVFGLLITIAIRLYDLRNTHLYDDLVGRGRQIEAELGIHTGHFVGRPKSTNFFIQHDTAIWAIYIISMVAWVALAIAAWFQT